jgi:hypothetical protein
VGRFRARAPAQSIPVFNRVVADVSKVSCGWVFVGYPGAPRQATKHCRTGAQPAPVGEVVAHCALYRAVSAHVLHALCRVRVRTPRILVAVIGPQIAHVAKLVHERGVVPRRIAPVRRLRRCRRRRRLRNYGRWQRSSAMRCWRWRRRWRNWHNRSVKRVNALFVTHCCLASAGDVRIRALAVPSCSRGDRFPLRSLVDEFHCVVPRALEVAQEP